MKRTALKLSTKKQVLHESGYKCANPACRTILTLDIHHLDYVSDDGSDSPENLLALCPNCHSLHHRGHLPRESLRAWKMLLISLNEGFPRQTMDLLLGLAKADTLIVSGEGVLQCAALLASDLVEFDPTPEGGFFLSKGAEPHEQRYRLELSKKGRLLVDAWKRGSQEEVVGTNEHA
jgi:hypothetical protein